MHAASVAARGEHRQRILDTVAHFRAKTVATNRESVTLSNTRPRCRAGHM